MNMALIYTLAKQANGGKLPTPDLEPSGNSGMSKKHKIICGVGCGLIALLTIVAIVLVVVFYKG